MPGGPINHHWTKTLVASADGTRLYVGVGNGDHVPPDYRTGLKDGAFHGFPYSYYGQHVDERVTPQNPELVAKAVAPDIAQRAASGTIVGYGG